MNIFTNRELRIRDKVDLLDRTIEVIYSGRKQLYEDLPKHNDLASARRHLHAHNNLKDVLSQNDITTNTRPQQDLSLNLSFLNDQLKNKVKSDNGKTKRKTRAKLPPSIGITRE